MEWRRCRTEVVHGLASYTFMEVARPGTEVPVDVTLREGIEQPGRAAAAVFHRKSAKIKGK